MDVLYYSTQSHNQLIPHQINHMFFIRAPFPRTRSCGRGDHQWRVFSAPLLRISRSNPLPAALADALRAPPPPHGRRRRAQAAPQAARHLRRRRPRRRRGSHHVHLQHSQVGRLPLQFAVFDLHWVRRKNRSVPKFRKSCSLLFDSLLLPVGVLPQLACYILTTRKGQFSYFPAFLMPITSEKYLSNPLRSYDIIREMHRAKSTECFADISFCDIDSKLYRLQRWIGRCMHGMHQVLYCVID